MKKILFLFLSISLISQAQTESDKKDKKTTVLEDAGDVAKLVIAKQKLYAGDFTGSLNTYREVEKNNPKDPSVLHYIGFCYFNLKQIQKAKEYLLKSLEVNPTAEPYNHLVLGKIYQVEGDFDKAIQEFTLFKSVPKQDRESLEDAEVLMTQCQNAKIMMASPLDVEVINLGQEINSKYDDKNPCITADGSKLVFTTRRPKNEGAAVDTEGRQRLF